MNEWMNEWMNEYINANSLIELPASKVGFIELYVNISMLSSLMS